MEARLPATAGEVIPLILALYEPSQPEAVKQIQETLHHVQKSPAAWGVARDLFGYEDDKVRFFAALTIIVKLNTESETLQQGDALELLANLLGWLRTSLVNGAGTMVVRKLTSALVTFFLHFPSLWRHCVQDLCAALSPGNTRPPVQGSTGLDRLGVLDSHRLRVILWFSSALVEEVGKIDSNTDTHTGIYEATITNLPDASKIMSHCLALRDGPDENIRLLREDCIKCYQAWIWFAQRVAPRVEDVTSYLRPLLAPTMATLQHDGLLEAAGELFVDILSNYSGFLQEPHYDALFALLDGPWAESRYDDLVRGDFDFESVLFGQVMLSLGDSRIQQLMEAVDDRSHRFLSRLRGLLNAQGFPVGEDKIFVPALEFWSTFVETLIDNMYSEETGTKSWVSTATSHALEAVAHAWHKIAFPPAEEFASWDSTDRVAFGDARKDVADLLQSTYTVMGPRLVSTFAGLVLERLASGLWLELEAAAFCLGSLADCVVGDACDEFLKTVFSGQLFARLQQPEAQVPSRVRQTCIGLVERYAEYFERDAAMLPDALRLLFSALSDHSLAGPAARSIHRLCSSSRVLLASEASAFIEQYRILSAEHSLDGAAGEKVIGAIAAVIQAIDSEAERLHYLEQLLGFVRRDAEELHRIATTAGGAQLLTPANGPGTTLTAEDMALKALRNLISIARGFQIPADGPLDLDDSQSRAKTAPSQTLVALQMDIMNMIQTLHSMFPTSGEVVEAICTILRAGFSETEPGPFVFSPDVVAHLFVKQSITGPRIGLFVSAACSFVSSFAKSQGPDTDMLRASLLTWVIGLLNSLPDPDSDTELAQNGIEFVTRMVAKRPEVLLQAAGHHAESFFFFALRTLDGREPLPKAAAADFWATFFALRSEDALTQSLLDTSFTQLGPSLGRALSRNIGGSAARSELDKLCDPLKKLVSHHARAKSWIEQGLFDPTFPAQHMPERDRTVFLKKIISLRGARATNQVVREFWLAARGSKFAYAS
ncbi:armadillo-type protein [Plectosphaerella cucumerina]|uniref:Armadillo-type protein n=1 Tax=Plectosphaerella cucumerina TaxID=40658 RepID=A0A8K0T8U5_9PEZI|nr:armadillo-type protein [Plectosphaerella cucumerina]